MQKKTIAEIVNTEHWGDYVLLALESPDIASAASPGQFVMIRVSSLDYPLLRRPLSIHARNQDTLEVFFQISGLGTSLLSQKKTGEFLDILGPFGRGFSLDVEINDKTAALIGGGRGIAPLYFLGQELLLRGIQPVVFYGGKTRSDLPLKDKFRETGIPVFCSTENGSFGFHGFVTDLFEAENEKDPFHFVYACGPEGMLKVFGQLCRKKNLPAEFSLESKMACGFGACWGCVTKIRSDLGPEWEKICEKGPVFPAESIPWTEEEK